MKINIGAGDTNYEGFLNCDYSNLFKPDYVFDLEKDKFPFDDNSVDEIIAYHVLEHLGEGYFHCLQEMYRVCKHGATINIKVPHYLSENQYHDPTHRRPITGFGLKLFDQEFNKKDINAASKLGLQFGVNFQLIYEKSTLNGLQSNLEELEKMSDKELYDYSLNKFNVFCETELKLKVIKLITIPKTILQTSKDPYPEYVKEMWKQRTDESWTIEWFDDESIIKFFKDNPSEEFPNLIDVFNSFTDGGHKADLFRYYYLYLNGGFFIDSDVMTHVHMNQIYSVNCDHIFVFSDVACNRVHHPEIDSPVIFNGLMGCVPKSKIVYEALKNCYDVKPRLLEKQRLYFVYMLYVIAKKYENENHILFFSEQIGSENDIVSFTLNDKGHHIATHYFGEEKIIPQKVKYQNE